MIEGAEEFVEHGTPEKMELLKQNKVLVMEIMGFLSGLKQDEMINNGHWQEISELEQAVVEITKEDLPGEDPRNWYSSFQEILKIV